METIALVEIDSLEEAKKIYEQLLKDNVNVHWYTYKRSSGLDLKLEIEDLKAMYERVVVVGEKIS